MKNIFKSKYFLYFLLSLPSIPLFIGMASYPWTEEIYGQLTHSSGETAVRLLILTLLISPLKLIFHQNGFWKWMMQHRLSYMPFSI
ncbi:MAG TPA: hypothetical protein ENG03_12395 [Thioploca sp.]|nr:hypothetical protein [Thioploca sp.]